MFINLLQKYLRKKQNLNKNISPNLNHGVLIQLNGLGYPSDRNKHTACHGRRNNA